VGLVLQQLDVWFESKWITIVVGWKIGFRQFLKQKNKAINFRAWLKLN